VNRAFGLTCADEQLFCRAVTFLIIIPCRNSRTLPWSCPKARAPVRLPLQGRFKVPDNQRYTSRSKVRERALRKPWSYGRGLASQPPTPGSTVKGRLPDVAANLSFNPEFCPGQNLGRQGPRSYRDPGGQWSRGQGLLPKGSANRTLNRHRSAGRAYQGVEVIVLKELGKMTP